MTTCNQCPWGPLGSCTSAGTAWQGDLNRPELTAERFMPNPFSPDSGTRLYKTGDWRATCLMG